MNLAVFSTIAVTGFTVAFFHAAIPTHWLPFVLTGRAQRWSRAKTLMITVLAGTGHVLFTTLLGVLVVWLGISLNKKVGDMFPLLAGGALIFFGLYYIVRHLRGKSHGHHHLFGGHAHEAVEEEEHGSHGGTLLNTGHGFVEVSVFETNVPPHFRLYFLDHDKKPQVPENGLVVTIETLRPGGAKQVFQCVREDDYLRSTNNIPEPHEFDLALKLDHRGHVHSFKTKFVEAHDHGCHGESSHHEHETKVAPKVATSDRVAIGSLLALLTFSPCEGFLPVYLSGIKFGWLGFVVLSVILAVGTVAGMVIFTWLTLVGMEKLKLKALEKYEAVILGGILCLLGILVILFEH